MSLISLKNSSETEVTVLSNRFIDNFMPRANGEFVKVYIYLLRVVSAAPSSFNLEDMADRLLCTDRDHFPRTEILGSREADLPDLHSRPAAVRHHPSGTWWCRAAWEQCFQWGSIFRRNSFCICFCCRNRFCFCCLRFCYLRADECECNQPSHSWPGKRAQTERGGQSASLHHRAISLQDADTYGNTENPLLLWWT